MSVAPWFHAQGNARVRRNPRGAVSRGSERITIREAPIITGKPGGIGRRLIFLLLVFIGIIPIVGQMAVAEPAAITEAKSEAEALREKIDELGHVLDVAVEDYNYAKAKLADTKTAMEQTKAQLSEAEQDLGAVTAQLTARLVEIYKQGELGVLDTLVGSTSFTELVSRLDMMKRLSEQDAQVVADVQAFQDEVTARKTELAQQIEDEKQLTADAERAKQKVEAQLAANEKALAGKEAEIAQLEKEEAARQARLAEEARKRAEEAKKKAAAAAAARAAAEAAAKAAATAAAPADETPPPAASGGSGGSGDSGDSSASGGEGASVPASADSADVVSIAMQYLGCPYVWAGASPDGFDCSGFVMYVYKQVGVRLPHSSRLQYGCGRPVSRSDLQPGDLVFFYSPISHVGIYIGDGQMIHAAGTGKNVRISDVWTSNYFGACRIIG